MQHTSTIFLVRSCPGDVCGSAEAPYVWEFFDAQGFGWGLFERGMGEVPEYRYPNTIQVCMVVVPGIIDFGIRDGKVAQGFLP